MVRIHYDPREVWKRIIPFQLVPLVALIVAVGIATGLLQVSSSAGIQLVFLAGLILYAGGMVFMVNALRHPDLLIIDDAGNLSWRPAFKTFRTKLPSRTLVTVTKGAVSLTPSVLGIPISRDEGNKTVIKLPMGVKGDDHATFSTQ